MRPFRGRDQAAPVRRRSAPASERPRLPTGNGLGSLPAPAGGLRPRTERPPAGCHEMGKAIAGDWDPVAESRDASLTPRMGARFTLESNGSLG